MMRVTATMTERGWVVKVPETTIAGKWRWSLLGPIPQSLEEDTGAGVFFEVDETNPANLGEYSVSLQRLDSTGGFIGDSQSSAPFVIAGEIPPVMIEVEVASPVSITVTKV